MPHAVRAISVLLADADPDSRAVVRRVLAGHPELTLSAAVADAYAAVVLAAEMLPDVLLVDPGADGADAIRAIRACSPATNVLVLSADADRDRIMDAVDAGAGGYLLKDDDPGSLPDAIRGAARGESPLAPRAARALIDGHRLPRRDARLPAMEKRALGLLARGCTDEAIAERLELAPDELARVLGVVIGALGVADRTQAALWAQRHGYTGGDGDPGQQLGPYTQSPGRIRRDVRPHGKRPQGRPHDAERCEDDPPPVCAGRDVADARDRRVR